MSEGMSDQELVELFTDYFHQNYWKSDLFMEILP